MVNKYQRLTRLSQVLAFLAVLFMAVSPHQLSAQPDESVDHSNHELLCDGLETYTSSSGGQNDMPTSHGDCLHHFDPLTQEPLLKGPKYVSAGADSLYISPLRQRNFSSDPPPPRHPS
jgi:hypothetical protein